MTSIIKVNNLQNQCGANIISESANVITIGASGDTVTLAAGASQSGFGRSGSVNWDTTPKTSTPVTAVSGNGYFINTTSIAITVNLPATPAAGDIVAIADYANTSATNNITVGRNGSNIDGNAVNGTINTNGQVYTLVYVDATEGWKTVSQTFNQITTAQFVAATGGTITTCGNYKIHSFTGPGTFTVTSAGNSGGSNSVDYLVVAAGGGGGKWASGGGAAGGFRESVPSPAAWTASPLANPGGALPVSVQGYPITVGGGGPGGVAAAVGTSGTSSVFSTITSAGGGGGGFTSCGGGPGASPGSPGASGGGSSGLSGPGTSTGGTGNTPPVAPPQGNPGGSVPSGPTPPGYGGSGGGGASAAGSNGTGPTAGAGGAGSPIATTVFGPTAPSYGTPGPAPGRYFAGGGGGSGYGIPGATGGTGGGGPGGTDTTSATVGTINTGGGGGGTERFSTAIGGQGGSGIVVIRYKFQ
jgi:hypothetical protein